MGIYPDKKFIPTSTGYIEEIRTPGLTRRRELTAGEWIEERNNCFCCSCIDGYSMTDPHCRNHGWTAQRPCEEHNMPGQVDEDGSVPDSVQVVIARRNYLTRADILVHE